MSEEGSEDSPPRPKRKIKKVMVLSSDSSSESDESVTVAGSRRKRLRVLSDDGSDSSGSSVVCAGRRKRALPKLRDSEGDSDTSGWATDHSDAPKPATSVVKPTSGFASDSSEGNSDKCSICLLRFTDQEVGTPQSCEHIFCLDCITEWSKNVNTCPVDRMTFDFIVVRACAGGRVLRTEPVKVVERRPSVELLVVEDPTVCEVCLRADNEETMLLCDGCDLGYHMQCLSPPLSEVPNDQWLCPNCDTLLSDMDFIFSGFPTDLDIPSRSALIRETRNVRSLRTHSADEPSTSSGHRGSSLNSDDLPTTSRGSRSAQGSSTRATTTRRNTTAHTHRRRPKRRRTKTVIIEYEVQENGKFPVTKRVKRKLKKRRTKRRQPRTAARRSHVLASVRAALLASGAGGAGGAAGARPVGGWGAAADQGLAARRLRAGIPALSLFGDAHSLDYFSEDDEVGVSERASTAVAARPAAAVFSAYRQARRKMISIPSPTHASSAPDVLSSILESQTLLHSKKSVVSISVDGSVNIKLETRENNKLPKRQSDESKKQDKLDLSQGEDATKKAPSYPGQSRGGRGWGGGYTGNYHREQGSNSLNSNSRGGYDGNYSGGGGYQNRAGNAFNQSNNARRDITDTYNTYSRRPHQYPQGDEPFERNRRPAPDHNRAQNNQPPRAEPARYSLGGPAWQPYVPPPVPHRHSFGGFENPLDMRMAPIRRQNSASNTPETPSQAPPASKPQPQAQPYRPLPEPPMFKFDKTSDVDKSEDEKSDSSLVIDTEKYDPTEPTNDDDSGDDGEGREVPPAPPSPPPAPPSPPAAPPTPPAAPPAPPAPLAAGVLDSAVRAVLHEHRALLAPAPAPAAGSASDDDSEGDCPNFSIYSATSVHIANTSGVAPAPAAPVLRDPLEDLVQEDDEPPEPAPCVQPEPAATTPTVQNKTEQELKEKVSKRCPITTNPRNPIKIKLNTPSLIKRQVSLYDEEMEDDEEEVLQEESESAPAAELGDELPTDLCAALLRTDSAAQPDDAGAPLDEARPDPSAEAEAAEFALESDTTELADTNHEEPDQVQDLVAENAAEIENDATTPDIEEEPTTPTDVAASVTEDKPHDDDDDSMDSEGRAATPPPRRRASTSSDELSADTELPALPHSPRKGSVDRNDDLLEKMTESISETEDERSYTPCLDENKSKDTSLETEKEKGIEGLDTEMISEDEGNEMFSDNERAPSERSRASPLAAPPTDEEGEIVDKKKEPRADDAKKKKKKDSKKEGKEKSKTKGKKADVAFKKLSKSGKERNYRDKDKKRERRDSSEASRDRKQRRKERRKDLERYDVRTLLSEKRRRPKDAFGRDVSPRVQPSLSPERLTPRPARESSPPPRRRRRRSVDKRAEPRRRRSAERSRKRRRDTSGSKSPRPKPAKRKKRVRSSRSSSRRRSPRRRSPRRRRVRRSRSPSAAPEAAPGPGAGPGSVDSRLLSPRTPPPEPSPPAPEPARRRREPARHRRLRDPAGPSKEVFTSGDNILVSVSFKDQERASGDERRQARRERRRRRKRAAPPAASAPGDAPRPVAIIDLERSPFRELTPSPRNVIVLSDSEPGAPEPPGAEPPAPAPEHAVGPKTPPSPGAAVAAPEPAEDARGPLTPPSPPDSPDAYDPYEPTRSASGSPGSAAASPPRACMTLEAAQKTNMSADEVIDRRPLSPIEKVMALLQSTRDVSPEPVPGESAPEPPGAPGSPAPAPAAPSLAPPAATAPAPAPGPAPPVRIVLPSPTRSQPPKLFLAKPSPIKSDPIKPMQAAKIQRPAALGALGPSTAAVAARRRDESDDDSPYSPGSSDFGDLFEPPGARGGFDALLERPRRKQRSQAAKVPVKLNRKKGKTQVGVKIDEDNLKILDDLPSSAVEMQVKSKFLKKLNRQERVVEEVKLVLKPHYNKKHVTKDEYKDILRRAVPKICHNKTGEINPSKIQALVEAYVKKFRKKHKLGLV